MLHVSNRGMPPVQSKHHGTKSCTVGFEILHPILFTNCGHSKHPHKAHKTWSLLQNLPLLALTWNFPHQWRCNNRITSNGKSATLCVINFPLKRDCRSSAKKQTSQRSDGSTKKGERKNRSVTGSSVVKRLGSRSLRDKRPPASSLMNTYQVHSSAPPRSTRRLLMLRRGGCRLSDSCAVWRGRGKCRLLWLYGRRRKEAQTCESLSLRPLTTVSTLPFHCCEGNIMDVHLGRALRRAAAFARRTCTLFGFLNIYYKPKRSLSVPHSRAIKSSFIKEIKEF